MIPDTRLGRRLGRLTLGGCLVAFSPPREVFVLRDKWDQEYFQQFMS